jgi:hypothetical protein
LGNCNNTGVRKGRERGQLKVLKVLMRKKKNGILPEYGHFLGFV